MIDTSEPVTTRLYRAGAVEPRFSSVYRPTVSGNLFSSLSMMNGSRKLFHTATNWNRKIVTSPGTIIGTAIRANSRPSRQPSTLADSSTSSGTAAFA